MSKIFKFGLYLCLIFCFALSFGGCKNKNETSSESNMKAVIGDLKYETLTEAVENAKSGDTIKVYDDLRDNKNVVISKPITIKGVVGSNQIKPKFYGSLTIDLNGEEDTIVIEDLDIIHQGVAMDGLNNDTRIGINLLDGGLAIKSSDISLDQASSPSSEASGIVVSRRYGSKNLMPIVIKGNSLGDYKIDTQTPSSALLIFSDKADSYQRLSLNEEELYSQNSFSTLGNGNQFMSISYSTTPYGITYLATSSPDELITALMQNQNDSGSKFILIPSSPLTEIPSDPVSINEKTTVIIDGNTPADLGGVKLLVGGSLIVNGDLTNATIEKTSPSACVIFGENSDPSKVTII